MNDAKAAESPAPEIRAAQRPDSKAVANADEPSRGAGDSSSPPPAEPAGMELPNEPGVWIREHDGIQSFYMVSKAIARKLLLDEGLGVSFVGAIGMLPRGNWHKAQPAA